jgi:hypothetical protein
MKPRYTHDCDRCKPLGTAAEYDLYFCLQTGDFPTVIARYGNDGWEYTSGIGSGLLPLRIAELKAKLAGYLPA